MNKYFLFFFALFSLSAEETIVVRLSTDKPLLPLYLTPVEGTGFEPAYLQKLDQILQFDLSHNGMTSVAKRTVERVRLSGFLTFDHTIDTSDWVQEQIFYLVKTRIQDKTLGARLIVVNNGQSKKVDGIALTGNLAEDRRSIHQLTDMIHKALFETEGVASSRFLYTIKNKGVADVWEADYDGGNPRQITHDNALCVTPSYIPPKPGFASGSFCYVSYKMGQPKLFVATLKEGKPQRLSLLRGNQLMPTINRQRDKLAFVCDITGNPDLFVVDFSPETGIVGKPSQIFSAPRSTQGTPTFSPDGRKIAFVSNKDGSPRIYMMNVPPPGASLKTLKADLVSKVNRENTAPAWAPDGTKIAYCSMSQGTRQIWIYDFERREERQITSGAGHKENPTWASNSLHLLFNAFDGDKSDIYLVNLNQPEAAKITSGPGEKRFPSFMP